MNKPKVSIIILNWNNYEDTKECLESLEKITYPNYEVIIVDNGSSDKSTQKIQEEFPQHIYHYNKENLGFAAGINIGIKYALERGSELFLILNNDVVVEKNFLEPLVDTISNDEKIGIIGPVNYNYYQPSKIISAGRSVNLWTGSCREITFLKEPIEVEYLVGSCMLIKKEVIDKIGYFYEPYFLFFEETEYCLRTRRAGFKIICHPSSKIWHKVSSTSNRFPDRSAYYFYRNKFLFIKRNAPFYIKWPFYFYYSFYLVLKSIAELLKGKRTMFSSILNALTDFWKGNFGKRGHGEL